MALIEVKEDYVRTRPKLIRRLRWVMILGLIGGPILIGGGVYEYLQMKRLKHQGTTVEAEVQDLSILNTGKGRRVYKVLADYRPEGHPTHRKEFNVRKEEYEAAQTSRKVFVTHLPSKPSVSSAGDAVQPDTEPIAIGAGVFIVALIIFMYIQKKRKEIEKAIFGEGQLEQ